ESVLIHGGSSGIGTAAIQLCAARGHQVFTTAGSAEKCAAIQKLGAHRAINYRDEDFVDVVKKETGGKGVDVILDMVGGDYIQRNMSAAALWGRIVNIAYQSGMQATVNFAPLLMKRLSLLATTLRARTNEEKGAIRDAVQREVWPLLEAGKIKPVVDTTFPLAEAGAAHARMAKSEHIGKILLTLLRSRMRILLNGANGFLGRYVLSKLVGAGYEVIPAVRNPAQTDAILGKPLSLAVDFNRDVTPEVWTPRLAGIDAVINCAGILQGSRGQSIDAIHNAAPKALFAA